MVPGVIFPINQNLNLKFWFAGKLNPGLLLNILFDCGFLVFIV